MEHADAALLGDADVEVAHHEFAEVVAGYLEEQLVLVQCTLLEGQHEVVRSQAIGAEGLAQAVGHGGLTTCGQAAAPDAAQGARGEQSTLLQALRDESGQLADFVLRILAHNLLQLIKE